MSIPSEASLLQNEVQILNTKPHKYLIGPGGDNVLRPDVADLSDHCPQKKNWNCSHWCHCSVTDGSMMSLCLGHVIAVRQHYKKGISSHCHLQTPS